MPPDNTERLRSRLARPRPGGIILFTGAGFSIGAENLDSEQIPLSRKFAATLSETIGLPAETPLTLASELYCEAKNDHRAFLELLKRKFKASQIKQYHRTIANFPWKRIYTTNYDDVAELANPSLNHFDRKTVPFSFESAGTQIAHLNGSVRSLTADTALDDFQLTLTHYMERDVFQSAWASTLRSDFRLASTIVFIGYSMYDTDISKIIYNNNALKEKTFLVQRSDLPEVEERFLAKFGTVIKTDLAEFAKVLEEITADGGPRIDKSKPENFVEYQADQSKGRKVSVPDVQLLLERGVFDHDVFVNSAASEAQNYVVIRQCVERICSRVLSGDRKILMHAGMGNGKSIIVECVSHALSVKHGYRVFHFRDEFNSIAYDIEALSSLTEKYVLVFDGLFDCQEVIEQVKSQLSSAVILVTERSASFELRRSEIGEVFGAEYSVFDVNKIEREDCDALIGILNSGAYWSDFDRATGKVAKRKIIEDSCASELSSISLGIVKSKKYLKEVGATILAAGDNGSKPEELELIGAALLLSFVNIPAPFWLISELVGRDMYSVAKRMSDDGLKDYFSIRDDQVSARSPIFAQQILREIFTDDFVVSLTLKMLRASSDRHKRARIYRAVNSRLMQFKNIEKLIRSEVNAYDILRSFYFEAGDIGYKDFSPPYWAQFAIAARAFEDFVPADRYFAEAQRIAISKKDYYHYKIDNAYAQFLLESRSRTNHWSDFIEAFREASRLAFSQTTIRQAGNYPYKVVERFSEFLAERARQMTAKQREEARGECLKWLKHLDGLPKEKKKLQIVRLAREAVSQGIDEIDAVS